MILRHNFDSKKKILLFGGLNPKKVTHFPARTRTWNLLVRSQTP